MVAKRALKPYVSIYAGTSDEQTEAACHWTASRPRQKSLVTEVYPATAGFPPNGFKELGFLTRSSLATTRTACRCVGGCVILHLVTI